MGSVNVFNVHDTSPHQEEPVFPVPHKCNNDVVHIREELSCQV